MEAIELEFLIEDLPRLLSSMKVGAERIQKIVLSLRNFSRMDEADLKPVNVHDGIESTLMILQARLKAKPDHPAIHVVRNYGNLPEVECYAGQLNQVFMNVLVNAIDALDERSFSTFPADLAQNPNTITISTEVTPDHWVNITIADNAKGIPADIQAKLFDPFFTTKPIGKGTGIGLSISYQIVTERHSGCLSCHSEVGKGTRFIITIPVRQAQGEKKSILPLHSIKGIAV
jgi:signal transduction histidine kinase